MPEIVRDGTGWLVADADQAAPVVSRLHFIDRRACRADAISRFGSDRMIEGQLTVFERVLERAGREGRV